jgi:hypothetical protein
MSHVALKILCRQCSELALGEHHQLDVVGIAAERGEGLHQVIDFVLGESEAEGVVRIHQRRAAFRQNRYSSHRSGRFMAEKTAERIAVVEHDLGHPIVDFCAQSGELGGGQNAEWFRERRVVEGEHVLDHAFDALDLRQSANVRDVRRFGRPRRNRARPGRNDLQ